MGSFRRVLPLFPLKNSASNFNSSFGPFLGVLASSEIKMEPAFEGKLFNVREPYAKDQLKAPPPASHLGLWQFIMRYTLISYLLFLQGVLFFLKNGHISFRATFERLVAPCCILNFAGTWNRPKNDGGDSNQLGLLQNCLRIKKCSCRLL